MSDLEKNRLPVEQYRRRERDESVVVADASRLLENESSPFVHIRHQLEQLRTNLMVLLSPGDKQFKDLPKRVRLMVVAFLIPVALSILKLAIIPNVTDTIIWVGIGVLLGICTYFLTIWGLKNQIRKESYIATLPLPSLFVMAYTVFLAIIFSTPINRLYLVGLYVIALSFFMVVLYVLEIAVNVLNVNLFYTIPLSRLGETVAYIASVIIVFFAAYAGNAILMPQLTLLSFASAGITSTLLLIIFFLLSSVIFVYFLPYQKGIVVLSLVLSVFYTLICVVTSVLLPYSWQGAVSVALIAYVLYGYLIHKEQNTLKLSVYLEFYAVSFILFLLIAFA